MHSLMVCTSNLVRAHQLCVILIVVSNIFVSQVYNAYYIGNYNSLKAWCFIKINYSK
jgi:hypothetical protein